MPESWEDLANGIIIQAVKDYEPNGGVRNESGGLSP